MKFNSSNDNSGFKEVSGKSQPFAILLIGKIWTENRASFFLFKAIVGRYSQKIF